MKKSDLSREVFSTNLTYVVGENLGIKQPLPIYSWSLPIKLYATISRSN
jgi:hypothetical protein